jgi:hypothetical protein
MSGLTKCGACNVRFTAEDVPKFDQSHIVTKCYHIFHKACLKDWAKEKESCPNCREEVYEHATGIYFSHYWNIFLIALEKDPEIVLETLRKSNHQNGKCTTCMEEYPATSLLIVNDCLVHKDCACAKDSTPLLLEDVVKVVEKVVEKYPELKKSLRPPSRLRTFHYKHPWVFWIVATELVSMGALMLNRYKFEGQNWALSAIGAPAYLTLVLAHQVGLLFFTVLNNK